VLPVRVARRGVAVRILK